MKTYKVSLTRLYVVLIKAENEKSARELTEFFLGDCPDLSTNEYRNKFNFSIIEREMTYNDAFEAEIIYNNE